MYCYMVIKAVAFVRLIAAPAGAIGNCFPIPLINGGFDRPIVSPRNVP
jgi:hypothetical protein